MITWSRLKYVRSYILMLTITIKNTFFEENEMILDFNIHCEGSRFLNFHGLVDPLCGTSWHKWNRYKLHRGIELVPWHKERPPSLVYDLCHGTRRGLFWPLLDPMEKVWYCASWTNTTCSNMLVPLGQVVFVPLAQAQPVPICLWHWDKVSPWPILGSFLIKNQRGHVRISEIPYQKSLSNLSKIET